MSRRTHVVLGASFLLIVLTWWGFSERSHSSSAPAAATEVADHAPTAAEAETRRQFDVLEQDRQAYGAEMSRRDAARVKRERAAAMTTEYRKELQISKSKVWTQIIFTNSQAYQHLRTLAAAAPKGTTPCTICNGRGSLDWCVLCQNTGKCPTCGGTGKLTIPGAEPELCPTCLGSGKCYLCGGTGRMACPFCEDGDVDIHKPPPPNLLPINN